MSEWTVDTLKEHHDSLIEALDAKVTGGFEARDKAMVAFEEQTKLSFASRNEIQTAMGEAGDRNERSIATLTATYITRAEALSGTERNAEDVKAVTDRVNKAEGSKTGIKDSISLLVALAAIMLALLTYLRR